MSTHDPPRPHKISQIIRLDRGLIVVDRRGLKSDSASRPTLQEFVASIFTPNVLTPKPLTARGPFEYALNRYLLPALGSERLADMSFIIVQNRIVKPMLQQGYKPQTVKDTCRVLSTVFRHARNLRYFAGPLPSAGIRLPKLRRRQARALTADELRAVLSAFAEPFRTMTLVSVTAGMSGAEVRGLHWKHLNLTRKPITVDGDVLAPASIGIRIIHAHGRYGVPKTAERRRNVLLPKVAVAALKRLFRRTRFGHPEDLVFSTSKGNPLLVSFLHGKIKDVGKRLGMPWLSWQCFRNTYAALGEECGVSLADRRVQLGSRANGCSSITAQQWTPKSDGPGAMRLRGELHDHAGPTLYRHGDRVTHLPKQKWRRRVA